MSVSVGHWVVLVCALPSSAAAQSVNGRLKVYFDCNDCFGDYIREEVDMVEYLAIPPKPMCTSSSRVPTRRAAALNKPSR